VIQVKGQGSECYNVFNEFCTCQGFFFDVLNKQEASCCKHQLATRIAQALGKVRENTVNDLVIAELLQEGG
jgi:predicted nucleic acid-binding Zn finger protein